MPNLTKDEPVLVVSAVGAVVSYVGSALVAHGVIGSDVMTSAEQTTVPIVASAVVLLLGALARRLVTPYAKVKDALERDGLMSEADFARVEQIVEDKLGVSVDPETLPTHDLGEADVPDGMSAGAQAVSS